MIFTIQQMLFQDIPEYKLVWWYKPWKIEKWFEEELFRYLRKDGYICYHPQDIWFAYKFLDWHLVSPKGELWWIELKKIKLDTFNVSQFEESQVILLRDLDKRNPELARVLIYSIKHNDYVMLQFTDIWNMKNDKWWLKIFWKK